MRPPRESRSRFRFPFDGVLGSEANVRLMRVLLSDASGPVSVADAARMAGLSPAGARKALAALTEQGFVRRVGTGRAGMFGPAEEHPLTPYLGRLFQGEREHYDELLGSLRKVVSIPEVSEAWVDEPLLARTLQVGVVAEAPAIGWIGPELRTRLLPIERRHDVIVEVDTYTRADSPRRPTTATALWGSDAREVDERPHAHHNRGAGEERSRSMATAIADMIADDPSLTRRAVQYLNMLLREDQGTATDDINEWRQLLETYSSERLRELLVARTSRAERLRRSSPFFAVLTPEERDRIARRVEGSP